MQIRHVTLTHKKDSRVLLKDFSLVLHTDDKIVLIGEEGNGKSTLLKWMADPSLTEDYIEAEGERILSGETVGYLPQELETADRDRSVYAYLSETEQFLYQSPAELASLAATLGIRQELFYSDQTMGSLSGGERVKIQMAGLLMKHPDIFLLDEPSNDIDIETLEWMEAWMLDTRQPILYISHDETLIERTANRVVLLEQLRRKTLPHHQIANIPYRQFASERSDAFAKQEQLARSERREEKKALERFQRIEQRVDHEQATISRQDPHGGRLLKKKMAAVKALERRYDREHEEMTEMPETEAPIFILFDQAKAMPAGKRVLLFDLPQLTAADGRNLAGNIHLELYGPKKVCITGRNGCGKTTLLRRIYEAMKDREDLKLCYMPQNYEDLLDMDQTPIDYLAPSGRKEDVTMVRTYLGSMKYTADEMSHPIAELSGGQKAKVLLLKMSISEADVLLLDEPTRNFSPLSGPVIREILRSFPGAIIAVSHDRKFIEEVTEVRYRLDAAGLQMVR